LEPLSILCTTCGRRLRVKDQRLVGQIIACPKCQGMVHIVPAAVDGSTGVGSMQGQVSTSSKQPPPQFAVGDPDIDSDALTHDGIMGLAPGAVPPGSDKVLNDPPPPKGWIDDEIREPRAEPKFPHTIQTASEGQIVSQDTVPPVAWQSESSARLRQLSAILAISVIGLLTAGTVFWIVIRTWQSSRQGTVEPTTKDLKTAPNESIEPTINSVDPSADIERDLSAAAPEDAPTDAKSDPNPTSDPETPQPPTSPAPTPQPPIIDSDRSTVEALSPDPLFPEPEPTPADDSQGTATEIPASLAPIMSIIDFNKSERNLPANQPAPPPAMEELRIQFPQLAFAETEFPPPAEPVDVRARGKSRVLGFIAEEQPLDYVLRFIGQTAGIPIELELLAFDIANVKIDQPVTVKAKETDTLTLLAGILQKVNCSMSLGDDSIVRVSPTAAELDSILRKSFTLDDLGGSLPVSEQEFLRLLGNPEGITIVMQANSLTMDGPKDIRLRAAVLLDCFRKARQLPTQLDPKRLARWIVDTTNPQNPRTADQVEWAPIPDHEVGINADQAYGIDVMLGDLAKDAGAALVIDWKACWTHGFTPQESSLPWFQGKKSHQVVEQLLRPFGLVASAPGDGIWFVTTPEGYEQTSMFAVLETDFDSEETMQSVAAAIGKSVESTPALVDPVSGHLIAIMPRYVLKRLPDLLRKP
jgi:hypothetical protein